MSLVIDASVFVAASRTAETQYAASLEFLSLIRGSNESLYCPVLVLAECSAAIARATGDAQLAQNLVSLVEGFPGLRLIPLTLPLARRAAELARLHRLRGADAVYVAVASELKASLITWDREVLQRVAPVVVAATPTRWIEDLSRRPPT
jgi:predicted nucleic acid-binding protein